MTEKMENKHPLVVLQEQIESERIATQIEKVLPHHIPLEKFQRTVVTAVSKNPDLVDADRQSLFTACVEAASDGLLPNGKESALVIYNTKVKVSGQELWIKKVQYMPMIRGVYKKARNSGDIAFLDAQIVYSKDHFDYSFGLDPKCEHKPYLGGDRGAIVGVYGVCKLTDGTPYIEFMTVDEIEYTRSKSKNASSGPWKDWWTEMARKTVIHRLAKKLPLSEEMEKLMNRIETMYEFEQKAGNPPAPRPQLGDFAGDRPANMIDNEPAQVEPEEKSMPVYPLVSEVGEVIEEISNGSGPWTEAFIKLTKAAKTLKAIEALDEGNRETIEAVRADTPGNAEAADAWLKKRHDEIRADLDKKAGEREAKKKAEDSAPYIVHDAEGTPREVKRADLLMAVLEQVVRDTFPADREQLFQNNTDLVARLDEEGMESAARWFEKACEPQAEAPAPTEGEAPAGGGDPRPEPPQEEGAPAEAPVELPAEEDAFNLEAFFVPLTQRASGDDNWSAYSTQFARMLVKCPLDRLQEVLTYNKEALKKCPPNWRKTIDRSIGAVQEVG